MNTNVVNADAEKKEEIKTVTTTEGTAGSSIPNQAEGQGSDEVSKLKADYEARLAKAEQEKKERDEKIANLSTTVSTMQTRQLQSAQGDGARDEGGIDGSLKKFSETVAYDPENATQYIKPIVGHIASAVEAKYKAESAIEKQKTALKSRHEGISDRIVETIFDTAERTARMRIQQGTPYSSLEEAIKDAEGIVMGEIEGYAKKKYSAPSKIPDGAKAETGTNVVTTGTPASSAPILSDADERMQKTLDRVRNLRS